MGRDKALLEVDGAPLVAHVTARLREVASPIVVVAAPKQNLPTLPGVRVERDLESFPGPLAALSVGLAACGEARWCWVTGVDMPHVRPAVVSAMCKLAEGHEAAALERDGRLECLGIVLSTSLEPRVRALLDAGKRSMRALLEASRVHVVRADAFAPELQSDVREAFVDWDEPSDVTRRR